MAGKKLNKHAQRANRKANEAREESHEAKYMRFRARENLRQTLKSYREYKQGLITAKDYIVEGTYTVV